MIDLQCVILAGGLGTRVRHVTGDSPKALVPINGVPFAGHQLSWLAGQGLREIVYSIGYRGEAIRNYVGDGAAWGMEVTYLEDGPRLLGTGGALFRGISLGVLRSPFLVLYGDAFLPVDYSSVVDSFRASGRPALMTVFRNDDRWGPSNAIYRDGTVVLYDKSLDAKTAEMHHIDYGLSIFTAEPIEAGAGGGDVFDLSDVARRLSQAGQLAGYEVSERFYEVGSVDGIRDLSVRLGPTPEAYDTAASTRPDSAL